MGRDKRGQASSVVSESITKWAAAWVLVLVKPLVKPASSSKLHY